MAQGIMTGIGFLGAGARWLQAAVAVSRTEPQRFLRLAHAARSGRWVDAFRPSDFTATGQLKLRPARQAAFATVPCGSRINFTGAPLPKSA